MRSVGILVVLIAAFAVASAYASLKAGECEVCIKVVSDIKASMDKKDLKSKDKIAAKIRSYCKTAKDRENRFCYYVGGTEDAATGMLNIITEPLVNNIPAEKICERTKTKDLQICELRYSKSAAGGKPLTKEELNKMRVGELKSILSDLGGECAGCSDKSEYVNKIVAAQAAKAGGKKEL